ncbi:Fic family protein [bacterium]|nr:Fic family protein [bacterium]
MIYENRFKDNDIYKAKIDAYRPLDENILKQIKAYFKISFTYTSNAIEGNSLSLNETKIIIEDGITIGGKPVKDHLEVIGNSNAYDLLFDIANRNVPISEDIILELHKILYSNIDETNSGKYRTCNVLITGSEYELPRYQQIPNLMKDFTANIESNKNKMHPVEFAAYLHERIVSIHPFIDGNGRTARLLMNLALLNAGYNIITIPPIVKNDYIAGIQDAQLNNNIIPFTNFISEMVLESQKEYLRIIERLK